MLAAVALLSLVAATQAVINTPSSLVTCEPTLLSWDATTAPYYLTVIPAGEPSATPLENLGTITGTQYTWNVDLAAGTAVSIALKDSTGTTLYTSELTITAGSSTSCVGASSSAASSSTSASTGVAAAASSVASSVSSAATSATSAAASKVSSVTGSSSSSTKAGVVASASKAASSVSAAAASASSAVTGGAGATAYLSSGLVATVFGVVSAGLYFA
jgi:hypothetical protein